MNSTLSPITKLASSIGKKVFYVISCSTFGKAYLRNEGGARENIIVRFNGTLSNAARFSTVNDALTFVTQATWAGNKRDGHSCLTYLSTGLNIVRVEETPGTEQRVVLGETQEAPKGAVVKYAIFGGTLTTALLYVSLDAAISAIQEDYVLGPISVRRVAVSAGISTLTETVLA